MDIRNICVFTAPVFSIFQCISIYLLGKEATGRHEVGIIAALCLSVNTGPVSRGVAGNFDNEAVAVFALVNTFYLWVKSVNTGSIAWSIACTLQYIYMVSSWGGYQFIINLIPLFVLGTMFINQFNWKIYISYSIFYTLGTILSLTIVFVNYQVMR